MTVVSAARHECHILEKLTEHAPGAIIPYAGRYYKRSKLEHNSGDKNSYTLWAPSRSGKTTISEGTHTLHGFVSKYMRNEFWPIIETLREHYRGVASSIHPHVARFYVVDVLQKLAAIHAAGIYHGDIKPNNLMMTDQGRVLFNDFGTAYEDCKANWEKTVMGTLQFLAPEWFRSRTEVYYGPRRPGDFWSVGVMLFHMVFADMVSILLLFLLLRHLLTLPASSLMTVAQRISLSPLSMLIFLSSSSMKNGLVYLSGILFTKRRPSASNLLNVF